MTINLKQLKYLVILLLIIHSVFLISCAEIQSVIFAESSDPAFAYVKIKYPLSEGSNSPDGMKAALKLNGKYYEGLEYTYKGAWYGPGWHTDIVDVSNYPETLTAIPYRCPIVKMSPNDNFEIVSDYDITKYYFVEFSAREEDKTQYSKLPAAPGIYLLIAITDDIGELPWLDENITWTAPDKLTHFAVAYQYVFAVIVE